MSLITATSYVTSFAIEFVIELMTQNLGKNCKLFNIFSSSLIFCGQTDPRMQNLLAGEVFADPKTIYICPFLQDELNPNSINNYLLFIIDFTDEACYFFNSMHYDQKLLSDF